MMAATRSNVKRQFLINISVSFRMFPRQAQVHSVGDLKLLSQSNLNENCKR